MAISLTDSAADRVLTYLKKRGSGVGLRLGISATGCSGYSYVINYADQINDEDIVFEDKGVTIVVDAEALPLVDGTEVNFVEKGLNQTFTIRNPNISGECGCGESFTV